MSARPFEVEADGVRLGGTLRGNGHPVLLLHGGPGLGVEYLEPLADELAEGYAVATYQQRGIAPSRIDGPFAVADHVADAVRVLDGLGWDRATLVGHSWGGHLALHIAATASGRLTGVLAVDPLGAVGDGGMAEFGKELGERTPSEDRIRAEELDDRVLRGEGTAEDDFESMRLYWPAYFSSREAAPPMPAMSMSTECYAESMESLQRELPALEQALPSIAVPVGFVVGAASPMPATASTDAADRIPGAWVESVGGAGHFVWFESPGAVRSALDRLTNG